MVNTMESSYATMSNISQHTENFPLPGTSRPRSVSASAEGCALLVGPVGHPFFPFRLFFVVVVAPPYIGCGSALVGRLCVCVLVYASCLCMSLCPAGRLQEGETKVAAAIGRAMAPVINDSGNCPTGRLSGTIVARYPLVVWVTACLPCDRHCEVCAARCVT